MRPATSLLSKSIVHFANSQVTKMMERFYYFCGRFVTGKIFPHPSPPGEGVTLPVLGPNGSGKPLENLADFKKGSRGCSFSRREQVRMRIRRTKSPRFERLNRGAVPGSAGVSSASFGLQFPTGRRDAGAPRRFIERGKQASNQIRPHFFENALR